MSTEQNMVKQPLSAAQIAAQLSTISGWNLSDDSTWLHRRYSCKNFLKAVEIVNIVTPIAQKKMHHPDISLGWGYCELKVQTHDAGGITEKDFALIAEIDAAISALDGQ